MRKGKKPISKKEFVSRVTELTLRHFSKMSPAEQERRLSAAERRLSRIHRDTSSTTSRTVETPPIRLSARSPHEER